MKNEGYDICYGYECGKAQDYRTMQDVDDGFAIYCDACHPIAQKLVDDIQKIDNTIEMYEKNLETEETVAGINFLTQGRDRMLGFKKDKQKELEKFGYSE